MTNNLTRIIETSSSALFFINYSIQFIIPIVASVITFFFAAHLISYYTKIRQEYIFQHKGSQIPLVFLSKVGYGSALLSLVYFFIQLNYFMGGNFDPDDISWSLLETILILFLAFICNQSKNLALREFQVDAIQKQNKIINAMVEGAGGYVWYKDQDGTYLFCDPSWCKFFFHLEDNCQVVGLTDIELLEVFRSKNKLRHTFGELCLNTDDHSRTQHKQCRYIECGFIGDQLVVLDVIKTPLFDVGDNYIGNIGFAWERAKECKYIFKEIEKQLKDGRAEQLADGVYYLKEDHFKSCKWDRPFPSAVSSDTVTNK